MLNNPYGAVPEALKEARLSIRDIAADMLMNKKLESDLSLAKSKAETETAMVQHGIERDKLNQEMNLAHLAETNRHSQVMEGQGQQQIDLADAAQQFEQGPKFDEQKRVNAASINASNASAGLNRAHASAINDQEKRLNEPVTARDLATQMGVPFMVDMLGMDPNTTLPRHKWDPFVQNMTTILKVSPFMQITATGYKLKSDLHDLAQQYNTPGLDPTARAKIKTNMAAKAYQLQTLDEMIMNLKEPDSTKVAESARKVWAENPQFATQYKNYDDFAQNYADQIKQMRGTFHNDMNNIKNRMATMDIDPNYMVTMKNAQQKIGTLADSNLAGRITLGTQNRLKAGDLQGAYDYTTNWARYLEAKKSGMAVPNTNTTNNSSNPASAGMERLASVGRSIVNTIKNNPLTTAMNKRSNEQTASYNTEKAALQSAGQWNAWTSEALDKKYPYHN